MKKLTYITDLANQPGGGGSFAVNWHVQRQLQRHFNMLTPGPIIPRVSRRKRFSSRVQRLLLNRPSKFFYFSPATLDDNSTRVAKQVVDETDAVFFRSATRWCHAKPPVPYFVYLDVVFHTFFENTFKQNDFIAEDLQRIFAAEARFLENAAAVFFESEWGLHKARQAYSLKGDHYHAVGRGGGIAPPDEDTWTGKPLILLSVAMNFEQKGGDIILEAFRRLKRAYPELRWHVVGGRPTGAWKTPDGLVYEGYLDPANEADRSRYRDLLARAFLLLHPTREDTNPLVLTEAAYFGCPSISVDRFAIPELVADGHTGILLASPVQSDVLAASIQKLIDSPSEYRKMRKSAFEFARDQFGWKQVGQRIAQEINARLS